MTQPVLVVVLFASALTAFGVIWAKCIRPLWRFVGWLRHEVKDELRRRKQVDELINRELAPDGGVSMKDQLTEIRTGQKTTFAVFDRWIEKNQKEHDELWAALSTLGIDRRHP